MATPIQPKNQPKTPGEQHLHFDEITTEGKHFKTGQPVEFTFIRNTEPSPHFGSRFGQDIEPAGRYMVHSESQHKLPPGWERGVQKFQNPLVIKLSLDDQIYGPMGWKARLQRASGGLTGFALSQYLRSLGHDGVVTVHDGDNREIVDLTAIPMAKSEELEKGAMQRLARFNPRKPEDRLDPEDESSVATWQKGPETEDPHDFRAIRGGMDKAPRMRALHKLSSSTSVRKNPKTGEREFLLHRGMSGDEWKTATSKETIDHPDVQSGLRSHEGLINHDQTSSWTPMFSTAKNFAHDYRDLDAADEPGTPKALKRGKRYVASAWIPESAIELIPHQYGAVTQYTPEDWEDDNNKVPLGHNEYAGEHEVWVLPSHNSELVPEDKVQDLIRPATSKDTLHGRINLAGAQEKAYGPDATYWLRDRLKGLKLNKSKPSPTFPGLGVPDNRRETGIVSEPRHVKIAKLAIKGKTGVAPPSKLPPGSSVIGRGAYSYALAPKVWNKFQQMSSQYAIPVDIKDTVSTQLHEDMHNIFNRVQHQYGAQGRRNLSLNLLFWLKHKDPEAHQALTGYTKYFLGDAANLKSFFAPEEHWAHLLSYLNSPTDRMKHELQTGLSPKEHQEFHNKMKRAYAVLQSVAPVVTGDWTQARSPVGRLGKSASIPAAILASFLMSPTAAQQAVWSPLGLHPELAPIAHLESSWGQHMNHEAHSGGEFKTAFGALGLKPETAHEEYLHSPAMQKVYPGLEHPDAFMQRFKHDSRFYNMTGSAHWLHLKKVLGTSERAAYGWRHGINAAKQSQDYHKDPYVTKYQALNRGVQQKMLQKSEQQDDVTKLLTGDELGDRMLGLRLAETPIHFDAYLDRLCLHDGDAPEAVQLFLDKPQSEDSLRRLLNLHLDHESVIKAIERPEATDEHLDLAMQPHQGILASVVKNHRVRPDQIRHVYELSRSHQIEVPELLQYFRRQDIDADELAAYVEDIMDPEESWWLSLEPVLMHHPKLSPEVLEAVLQGVHPIRNHALTRVMSDMELARYISDPKLNHNSVEEMLMVIHSQPRISLDNQDRLVRNPDPRIRDALLQRPDCSPKISGRIEAAAGEREPIWTETLKSWLDSPDLVKAQLEPMKPKKSKKQDEPKLVVIHNLHSGGLLHASKLGGLPAPSLAITHVNHPLSGFGDISLVAHHKLVDPQHTPVFGADVYSPRHPRVEHEVLQKPLDRLKAELKPHIATLGTYAHNFDDELKRSGPEDALSHHDIRRPLALAWLESKGHKIDVPVRNKPLRNEWVDTKTMRDFRAEHPDLRFGDIAFDSPEHKALSDAARKAIAEYALKAFPDDAEERQWMMNLYLGSDQHFSPETGNLHFGKIHWVGEDLGKLGQQEPDHYRVQDAVDAALDKENKDEFRKWAHEKLAPTVGRMYIPKQTSSGNTRRIPYTLENVLKEMTRKIRQGEGFNYGLGTARAGGARQFRTIEQIKKARRQIVSKEKFDEVKEKMDKSFNKLADIMAPYHSTRGGFGMMDALAEAIGESYKRGHNLWSELKNSQFKDVPPHVQEEVAKFAQDLLAMPTEYFEAKPQRIVNLQEFHAAVVPKNVDHKVLEKLKQHGLDVEFYDPSEKDSRQAAIQRVTTKHNLALSEPEYDDLQKQEQPEPSETSDTVAYAMLGFSPEYDRLLRAAAWLAGIEPVDPEIARRAFWKEDGDSERAALVAVGLDVDEENLKALRNIQSLTKAEVEVQPPHEIRAGTETAAGFAHAVERGFAEHTYKPVNMGGKHSNNSAIVHDPEGGRYLLKPASGGVGPAAGIKEESATQARRETAFYYVAKNLGLDVFCPRAELLILDGSEWAAMSMLPMQWKNLDQVRKKDPTRIQNALENYRRRGILHRWAVMDWVCGNVDRHAGNVMIGPEDQMRLIDHGSTFAGPDFDPGKDQKSFVPFYLRYRYTGQGPDKLGFNQLPPSQQLAQMPVLEAGADAELRRWIKDLRPQEFVSVLERLGMRTDAVTERLAAMQRIPAEGSAYAHVNVLWLG